MTVREGRVLGKVLFRRESGLLEGLGKDFRSAKVLLLLTTIVVMGGALTVSLSQVARILPVPDESLRLYFYLLIIVLAAAFFLMAAAMAVEDRGATVITDRGILYGGIFQRWAEIRCCVMRKTRRGLIVWTRSRRRLRMYFRGKDTDHIEKLFLDFCSTDAFSPDCSGRHQ